MGLFNKTAKRFTPEYKQINNFPSSPSSITSPQPVKDNKEELLEIADMLQEAQTKLIGLIKKNGN